MILKLFHEYDWLGYILWWTCWGGWGWYWRESKTHCSSWAGRPAHLYSRFGDLDQSPMWKERRQTKSIDDDGDDATGAIFHQGISNNCMRTVPYRCYNSLSITLVDANSSLTGCFTEKYFFWHAASFLTHLRTFPNFLKKVKLDLSVQLMHLTGGVHI